MLCLAWLAKPYSVVSTGRRVKGLIKINNEVFIIMILNIGKLGVIVSMAGARSLVIFLVGVVTTAAMPGPRMGVVWVVMSVHDG